MTQQKPVLDYAPPPARRSIAALFTPKNIATVGAVVALASLIAPFDIGSGRVIVNPVRELGCYAAVACAMLYTMLRLWRDPAASVLRRVVFTLCFLVALWSFWMAHSSVWGRTRLPPFEMRFEFWRWIAVMAVAVAVACIFSAVSAVARVLWRTTTIGPASLPEGAPDRPARTVLVLRKLVGAGPASECQPVIPRRDNASERRL